MEIKKPTENNLQLLPMLGLADWFLFSPFFCTVATKIQNLISRFPPPLRSPPIAGDSRFNGGAWVSRDDVRTVMENLGLFSDEEIRERYDSGELTAMFEKKEPSLEEVKKTFNVLDENGDGFIDAEELQRVMRLLGAKEGEKKRDCEMMIAAYDRNKDGKIDFDEFVRLMENAFC